jgi:type VI protein secretion system component VasA
MEVLENEKLQEEVRGVSNRQIESIEKLTVCDDVQPHITDGWRGYYRGTKFSLTLTERKFDGSSTILFSRVVHQFLALFCHVNSFVRLELNLSNGSSYQCQPMSGHQMII